MLGRVATLFPPRQRSDGVGDPVPALGGHVVHHWGPTITINGGITSGNELIFRVAVRPTASIGQSQQTIDLETGRPVEVVARGRHDVCFALRVPVIVEAACAVVLADLMLLEQRIPRILKVRKWT